MLIKIIIVLGFSVWQPKNQDSSTLLHNYSLFSASTSIVFIQYFLWFDNFMFLFVKPGCSSELSGVLTSDAQLIQIKVYIYIACHSLNLHF